MAGGLLNLKSEGSSNVILNGNPSKTFFTTSYSRYTNFALERFRLDYEGQRDLRLTEPSTFTFKVKKYADLMMDTYICITLPDIWSPIYHPCPETNNKWAAYDFRWIRDLGTHMIKEIVIAAGSHTLAKYSGEYIAAVVDRDYNESKKKLFNEMTGNTPEFYDIANAYGRANTYPSAFHLSKTVAAEPSFRSRKIYVPINAWFTLQSQQAFPLICLQYSELTITVTIRAIQDLFQVRDVFDDTNNHPYMRPDFNLSQFQMYRYLQTPPSVNISTTSYENKTNTWNADIHIISTMAFLSEEERRKMAMEEQIFLVKDVFEYRFENVTGSKKVSLTSIGPVANWMWYFQRNDVFMRNEWSNYTNWPYRTLPSDVITAPITTIDPNFPIGPIIQPVQQGEAVGVNTGLFITGLANLENVREIMVSLGIQFNGDYREKTHPSGIYELVEKYTRTAGNSKKGVYSYNFCLNTDPHVYQPSGACNMTKFKNVELEITTIVPTVNQVTSALNVICDVDGNPIGVDKTNWRLYDYTYNMTLFEERYNLITFINGQCGLMYAR